MRKKRHEDDERTILDWAETNGKDNMPRIWRGPPRSLDEEIMRMGLGELFEPTITKEPEIDDMEHYRQRWMMATGRGY